MCVCAFMCVCHARSERDCKSVGVHGRHQGEYVCVCVCVRLCVYVMPGQSVTAKVLVCMDDTRVSACVYACVCVYVCMSCPVRA